MKIKDDKRHVLLKHCVQTPQEGCNRGKVQQRANCQDMCPLVGWTIGVVLALLVAIVLSTGIALPSIPILAVVLPFLIGSFLMGVYRGNLTGL